jgi:hypothetical protein
MNFEQAQIDILLWVTGFVEQPNAQLQGWAPCPYARKARLDKQFEIRPGRIDPYTDLMTVEMKDLMVIAYVYDPADIDAREFNQQIDAVNQAFLLPRNMIALSDHPGSPEQANGVLMNQGTWAIAFVQHLDKLNQFARLLARQGYYEGWSEDYLGELFQGREDPRQ